MIEKNPADEEESFTLTEIAFRAGLPREIAALYLEHYAHPAPPSLRRGRYPASAAVLLRTIHGSVSGTAPRSRFGRLVEAELKMLDTLYEAEALLEEISRFE